METNYLGYDLISVYDIIMVPFSIMVSYIFIMYISRKMFGTKSANINIIKKAFIVKTIFLFIFFGILFTIYSDRNDQMSFYYHLQIMNPIILDDPMILIDIFLNRNSDNLSLPPLNDVTTAFLSGSGFFSILKTEILLLPLSFNSFLALNIYGTYLGFIGLLLIYATLDAIHPNFSKKLAFAIFYIPTVNFYTCGIVKEGISILAMGLLFYFFYKSFILKRPFFVFYFILLVFLPIGFFAKPYIFLLFIPSLVLWVTYPRLKRTSIFSKFFIITISTFFFVSLFNIIGGLDTRFALTNVIESASLVQEFTSIASSAVDGKGNYEPVNLNISGAFGIFKVIIEGLLLSFFRPYFWEAKSFLFIFVSIENLCVTILFLKVIFNKTPYTYIATIFFLFFVIPFSIFVSVSNANFGALLRYKAPMMPFLLSFLIIHGTKVKNFTRS